MGVFKFAMKSQFVLVSGLLIAAALSFFAWRLRTPDAFLFRPGSQVSDITVTFWPNIHYIQQTLQDFRELPLWRTLIFSGSPFDADPQSGLWYPPNLIFLFLPAAVGFNFLFVLHAAFGGLGMWVWSRWTGTSLWASLFSGLAFLFAPKSFAHLGTGHAGLYYAAAFIPWVLAAAYRLGLGQWRFASLLGLSLGMQAIAHPQLAFYTGIVAGIYGIAVSLNRLEGGPRTLFSATKALALGAVLAVLVAAVQWLPLMRLAPASSRAGMSLADSAISSLSPQYLLGLVLPDYGGFMDYVLYVGIPVLALAVLAWKRRQAWFWWGFVLFALLYSLGTNLPLYRWAFEALPALVWLRAPSRIWFVASAALALLSGWGLDRLFVGLTQSERRWINLGAMFFGVFALALWIGYQLSFGTPPRNLIALGVIVPFTALTLVGLASGKFASWLPTAGLFFILMVDLWIMDASLVEGRSFQATFFDSGVGAHLSERLDEEPFRVYSPSYSLPRHIAAQYGLETADGVDPLFLDAYDRFVQMASGVPRQTYGVTVPAMEGGAPVDSVNQKARPNLALLGLLNVRYIASEFPIEISGLREIARFGKTHLYENSLFLPRAFVVGSVESVSDLEAALNWVDKHDLGREAVVERGSLLNSGEVHSEVTWLLRSPDHLALRVKLDRKGFLVLSQAWYPGWKLTVDGQPGTLWKADGNLNGAYLDPGTHILEWNYRPPTLAPGLSLSFLGWGICLGLLFYRNHPKPLIGGNLQ